MNLSPAMLTVMADALAIAIASTRSDQRSHAQRVAKADARIAAARLNGTAPSDEDVARVQGSETIRLSMEAVHDAQTEALELLYTMGAPYGADIVAAAREVTA